jgi:hypothetical protein
MSLSKEKEMDYIIQRIKEPSTWAGVSVVLVALGFNVSEAELATIGGGISAFLAIILRERGE